MRKEHWFLVVFVGLVFWLGAQPAVPAAVKVESSERAKILAEYYVGPAGSGAFFAYGQSGGDSRYRYSDFSGLATAADFAAEFPVYPESTDPHTAGIALDASRVKIARAWSEEIPDDSIPGGKWVTQHLELSGYPGVVFDLEPGLEVSDIRARLAQAATERDETKLTAVLIRAYGYEDLTDGSGRVLLKGRLMDMYELPPAAGMVSDQN